MSRARRALLLAATLGVGLSLAAGYLVAQHTRRRPDVIVVLVDTLRADALGAYGAAPGATPFLDELAGRSHVFTSAVAATSWTNPSVASLFTSRFASDHGATSFLAPIRPDLETLAEALRVRGGLAPAAFVANPIIPATLGFDRGFHRWETQWEPDNRPPMLPRVKIRANLLHEWAATWLDRPGPQAERPVFLYLHYFEPHNPYSPPREALEWAASERGRPIPDADVASRTVLASTIRPLTPDERADLTVVYAAEVHALDGELSAFFADLERRGRLANSIVVVTADHGEEFGEHDHFGHGRTLYDEVTRVPLLISLPGQKHRVDVATPISLTDLAPTITELTRTPRPPTFGGRSLVGLLDSSTLPLRVHLARALGRSGSERDAAAGSAYAELPPSHPGLGYGQPDGAKLAAAAHGGAPIHRRSMTTAATKVVERADEVLELFDRARDPGETRPLAVAASNPSPAVAALVAARDTHPFPTSPGPVEEIDEGTRGRLRALGYVN